MKQKITFSFGKNWDSYLKSFYSEELLEEAKKSLKEFMKVKDLKGLTFMDIGCGSGIFSLASYKLGAKKIISFDVDKYSVNCCELLRKRENSPTNWDVFHESVLDEKAISKLEKADIVYSWGVLHHTGDMWEAITNASKLVKNKGLFYIAIYNKKKGFLGSEFWLKVKKRYNNSSKLGKWFIKELHTFALITKYIITLQNPIKKIKNYKSKRGMNWKVDLVDWVGGYPYEYATTEEISSFLGKKGFKLVNTIKVNNLDNNQFLFRKNK